MTSEWKFDFTTWNVKRNILREDINNRPDTNSADVLRDWYQIKKFLTNLENNVSEIAKEEILCRRHGKQTDRHKKLIETHQEMMDNIDGQVLLFKLMHS